LPATRSGSRFAKKPYETPTCDPLAEAEVVERLSKAILLGPRSLAVPVVAVQNYSDTLYSLARAVDEVFRPRQPSRDRSTADAPGPPVIIVLNLASLESYDAPEDSHAGPRLNVWSIPGATKASGIAAAVAAVCGLGRDELRAANRSRGERND
jgi:hypothetical protein